ncbi:DUF3472 domain-containing protein [Streptomyces sp. FIT100]|uniref:DUF3472 domain-containing protein n=1 Tax=Streptomyces sp. FIT100 TaxID=2837956 RepID=UPI0021C84ADF|nr:hypothetical protein [Streptomyces sp. FIT100]UUN30804.1 hypothetical protein KK483_34065 [Streptomyces sp. FIT100]
MRKQKLLRRLGVTTGVVAGAMSAMLYTSGTAAAAVTPGHLINAYHSIPGAPAEGLNDISYHVIVNQEPTINMFFAQAFYFKNGQVGYMGLQPRPDGNDLALFSVFGSGASTTDPNCRAGADGGEGVSCSVRYPYQTGRQYRLKIQNVGGSKWEGIVYDTVTATTTHIGSWTVSSSAGKLKPNGTMFMEAWQSVADCNAVPKASAYFSNPQGHGSSLRGSFTSAVLLGPCKDKASYSIQSSGLTGTTG